MKNIAFEKGSAAAEAVIKYYAFYLFITNFYTVF